MACRGLLPNERDQSANSTVQEMLPFHCSNVRKLRSIRSRTYRDADGLLPKVVVRLRVTRRTCWQSPRVSGSSYCCSVCAGQNVLTSLFEVKPESSSMEYDRCVLFEREGQKKKRYVYDLILAEMSHQSYAQGRKSAHPPAILCRGTLVRVWGISHKTPGSSTNKNIPYGFQKKLNVTCILARKGAPGGMLSQHYMQRPHQYHGGSYARTFKRVFVEKAVHCRQI